MKKITSKILIILIIIGIASFIIIEGLILIEGSKKATNKVDYVVILGARLYGDIPEAQAMAKYLVDNGIEENRIIIEDKSTFTFEYLILKISLFNM